jgi:hypothetical protein
MTPVFVCLVAFASTNTTTWQLDGGKVLQSLHPTSLHHRLHCTDEQLLLTTIIPSSSHQATPSVVHQYNETLT